MYFAELKNLTDGIDAENENWTRFLATEDLEELSAQSHLAGNRNEGHSGSVNSESDDDDFDDTTIIDGNKLSKAALLEILKKSAQKFKNKDVLAFVEDEVRQIYNLIPPDDREWKPPREMYGTQKENGKLVLQPCPDAMALPFGQRIGVPLLVSQFA